MSSAPQHLQALERANAVRLARAALKRAVAAGEVAAQTGADAPVPLPVLAAAAA